MVLTGEKTTLKSHTHIYLTNSSYTKLLQNNIHRWKIYHNHSCHATSYNSKCCTNTTVPL